MLIINNNPQTVMLIRHELQVNLNVNLIMGKNMYTTYTKNTTGVM